MKRSSQHLVKSNLPEIRKFVYTRVDPEFPERALAFQKQGFIIVAGNNYGQGASREHALSQRQIDMVLQGSYINVVRQQQPQAEYQTKGPALKTPGTAAICEVCTFLSYLLS